MPINTGVFSIFMEVEDSFRKLFTNLPNTEIYISISSHHAWHIVKRQIHQSGLPNLPIAPSFIASYLP